MTDESQREVQRLTAELTRKERENTELKEELAHTKNIQDDLWSHDIYLKARRKMLGGVFAVLSVLSALGLYTVYELYQRGLTLVETKVADNMDSLIQEELPEIIEITKRDLQTKVDERIGVLIDQKKAEIGTLIAEARTDVDAEIALMKEALNKERVALTEQAR